MDEMLLRVYEPILFRSLQAANPAVRENAAQLLFACFPLQNPEAAHEDIDEALSQQFQHAAALLKDPCPKMRASAVRGVVALLDAYWELIPPATTAGFIACIVDDLVTVSPSSAESIPSAPGGLKALSGAGRWVRARLGYARCRPCDADGSRDKLRRRSTPLLSRWLLCCLLS